MLLPDAAPLFRLHVGAGGLHLVIEPGDAGQNVRRLLGARRRRLVELPPGMRPASHFHDTRFPEEIIVAAVGVGVNITPVIIEVIERSPLAAINGEVVGD
jgi:hypothetical protein